MTHDSAVRIVVSLVPDIEKSGAAEVLTKYASAEDIPPAQLEKLGQVYNTLRTVSHIDNADESERGATVPLLDVPELVVGYATGLGQEKAALSPISASSHDPSTVDLNVALMRDMADPIEKAASKGLGDDAQAAAALLVDRDAVADSLLDLELDFRDEMSKWACAVFDAAPQDGNWERDISYAEREALYLQPEHLVKAAGDFMEKFAEPHHVKLTRHDYSQPITKRAFAIADAEGEKFAKLAEAVGSYDVIVKLAMGDPATMEELKNKVSPEDQALSDVLNVPTLDPNKPAPGEAPPPEKEEKKDGEEKPDATDKLKANKDLASGTDQDKEPDGENANTAPKGGGGGGGGGGSKGGGGKTDSGSSLRDTIGTAMGALGAPIAAAGEGVRNAAAKADETLTAITGKERRNKSQKATDVSVEDIRRAINVRRMIGTDPVLREADPQEVLEVYNAIAQKSPEVANDMASLKLILREAVSYEGLTLDSQKMLSEIHRNSEQGAQVAAENDKKRYATGGTSPIPITTK